MASHKEEMLVLEPDLNVETKRQSTRNIFVYVIAGILVVLLISIGLVLGLYFGLKEDTTVVTYSSQVDKVAQTSSCRSGSRFQNFSVASDTAVCSEIGCQIFEKGGSTVDAAIASLLCITVVTMHSSGIGGGAFMLVYQKKTRIATFINARETAPAAATEHMFVNDKAGSRLGPLSAAVPGELKGMIEAHKRFGKLEWSQLVQPSIDLADNGFQVTHAVEGAIERSFQFITDQDFRALLTNKDGTLKREHDTIINKKLARTLKEIQRDPESFYSGKLAKKIAADFRKNSGLITELDLKEYKAKVTTDVLKLDFPNGLTMFSCPPPSGGSVVTQILNILQHYNFNGKSISDVNNTILTYHRIIEAFKFAYARRPSLGDPDFVNIEKVVKNAMDVDYNRELFKKIWDNATHNTSYYGGWSYIRDEGSTSHLSVLGPNGDAVAVTSSINFYFGGKFRSNVTGIIYNNEMDDFSTPGTSNGFGYPPSKNNFISPGKRPLSSMSPTIFVDKKTGDVKLAIGAAGGSRIITTTAWVSLLNLWMGASLSEAIKKPRLHNQLFPADILTERTESYSLQQDVMEGLKNKGHAFGKTFLSVVQAVGFDEKEKSVVAVSDPRKGGAAWGQ